MTAAGTAGTPAAELRRLRRAVVTAYLSALLAGLLAGWLCRGLGPIWAAAAGDLAATLVVFGFSVRHDSSSLYDPYWSAAPPAIALGWLLGADPGVPPLRQALVLVLLGVWSARLTFNCMARWRSLALEDFRYADWRARTGRAYWPFSLLSFHLMPTVVVFLGLLPLHRALTAPGRPLGPLDGLAALVAALAILVEAAADAQLRAFLEARRAPDEVLATGLWARVRHPNYSGEVRFWWGAWLFGLAAAPDDAAGLLAGPAAVTVLFSVVSVPLMDAHMRAGHPAWAARLAGVPALLPWPGRQARAGTSPPR